MTIYNAHDLGGARGFGPVDRSRTAQFAHEWEESVFGMTLACGMLGQWNLDQSRSAREQMEPAHYLGGSYYEHWLHGLELLLRERGLVSADELRSGKAARGRRAQAVGVARVTEILATGAPTLLPSHAKPRFAIGARVTVRDIKTQNHAPAAAHAHTRAPAYTRGHEGQIIRHHGAHIFPDQHAAGARQPQHLYSVRFAAETLWGKTGAARPSENNAAVYVDLFEPYLTSETTDVET